MSLKNPYSSFLDEVEKPARYIGGEKFLIQKDWDKCIGKVALCFPDVYEIGMSHLGFKILYEEINRHDNMCAERCFAPWIDMEQKMRDRSLPLVTLENFRPLKDFDIVGFSLQYEMSYSNILNMLELGGITVKTEERGEHEPFVIAGGPCATHPEPIAPFMDFIVVGDGEKLFSRIVHFVGEARLQGWGRDQILLSLATWDGIYVPKFYNTAVDDLTNLEVVTGPKAEHLGVIPDRIKRHFVDSLKNYPFPTKSPIPHMTAIFDRFSVELARGCTEGCRFCQAGMIYRPVRERDPKEVIDLVMEGLKNGGFDEASLTCLSTADYSAVTPLIIDLLDKMSKERATLGISSLRAYGLDERVLDKLSEVKNSSLTFAPEAGSERMRKVINKNVTEEDMLKTAENVFSRGWSKMKLYFMIGLPTEDDEDVIAIMESARNAKYRGRQVGCRNPEITVSVSSFVPKPHTPFQWASMITLSEIQRKQNLLDQYAKQYRLNFRKHYSKISHLEGIVSRGDRRVGEIIYQAWKKGARFDGWDETFKYDLWMDCVNESGINPESMLGTIPMGRLPWDHIDVGLEDRFLEIEWIKATKNRLSPPCGKVAGMIVHHTNLEALEKTFDIDKKKLVCYHCGVACDLKGMVEERKDFLKNIDSIEDAPYVRPEGERKTLAEMRDKRGQVLGYKYRIEFSKIGSLSFISHLDLQKIMARIFKRADIEVFHSEGYNVRPLISFGPALSLGISSLIEFFDVRVPELWHDTNEILERLQSSSEKGIVFRKAELVAKGENSIQELTTSFKYFLPVKNVQAIDEAISKIMNEEKIVISSYSTRLKKDIEKDIRPVFLSMNKSNLDLDKETRAIIDEVSPLLDGVGVEVVTEVDNGATIRPSEILNCLKAYGLEAEKPIKIAVSLSSQS